MVNDMQYSLVIYSTAYQSDFNGVSSHIILRFVIKLQE
jgi:hypothetical protein